MIEQSVALVHTETGRRSSCVNLPMHACRTGSKRLPIYTRLGARNPVHLPISGTLEGLVSEFTVVDTYSEIADLPQILVESSLKLDRLGFNAHIQIL